MFKLVLEKAEESGIKLPTFAGSEKKQEGSRKSKRVPEKARGFQENIYFCLMTMPKPLTVWITINCGKF